jgi:hypothetical protein
VRLRVVKNGHLRKLALLRRSIETRSVSEELSKNGRYGPFAPNRSGMIEGETNSFMCSRGLRAATTRFSFLFSPA